jgi:Pyruvate/2-oxoacid:ferredoxin oxidoreductase delta subunit
MAEAIEAYCHGDETFAAEILSGETKFGRTLVHETALRDETPEVLGWERASAIVEESPLVAVTLCYCRHVAEHLGRRCEAPMENCLSFGQAADFIVRRGFGHSIEKAQAQEILAVARGAGLVQIADNVKKRPVFICNCCGCCCEQLQAIRRFGLPAVNPSGLQPVHAADACKGCSRCARICPVGAITMVARLEPGRSRNELRPSIDLDRCIGCGVCADGCRKHAVGLERRPEQPKVPETGMERVVLMALDQGVLGELLFEDAGRGGRFLGRVLDVVAGLPPTQLALAFEQVRSRYVRFLLGRTRRSGARAAARV